jgi:hypothetical protein
MDGVPDIGQQFLELICGLGLQATEEVLKVGEGIDVVMLTGPNRRPDTNQQPRGARRSDDTEATGTGNRLRIDGDKHTISHRTEDSASPAASVDPTEAG